MPRFYEVRETEIIVYKHRVYGPVQIAFATLLTPVLVHLLVNGIPAEYMVAALSGVAVVTLGVLIYLQYERIIFDLKERKVFRELPVLGRTQLAGFDEIAGIEYLGINRGVLSPLVKHSSYCRMVLKWDKLGAGIKILTQIKNDDTQLLPFNEEVLQPLNLIFSESRQEATVVPAYERKIFNGPFTYLKEKSSGVYSIGISIGNWLKIAFCLGVIFILYQAFIQGGTFKDYIDAIIYIGFPVYMLYIIYSLSVTVQFDTNNRIITVTRLWGLFKKKYAFSSFSVFYTVIKQFPVLFGTDMYLAMHDNSLIFVGSMRDTKKLKEMEDELRSILIS